MLNLDPKINLSAPHHENRMTEERYEKKKIKSIIEIQSFWRGCLARNEWATKHPHLLSYPLFARAKPYIDHPDMRKGLKQPLRGMTPVYFLDHLSLVLKQSGSPANAKRLEKMQQAREICQRNGYQHLMIPRARIYKDFIVENKLPIHLYYSKEHIGFYAEYHAHFDQAVREFLGFLSQSYLGDILNYHQGPFRALSQAPQGRYDNVALYLENGEGKVALVDLEEFSPSSHKDPRWRISMSTCKTVIYLFPYHFEEIMDEAIKLNPAIEYCRQALSQERDEALKRFKIVYDDHLNFIKKKAIISENPISFEKIELATLERLKKVINEKLLKWHEKTELFKGCLGESPEKTLMVFNERAFPILIKEAEDIIEYHLAKNKEERSEKEEVISSYSQLLAMRTVWFERCFLECNGFTNLLSSYLDMMSLNQQSREELSIELLKILFKELKVNEIISYYHFDSEYDTFLLFC